MPQIYDMGPTALLYICLVLLQGMHLVYHLCRPSAESSSIQKGTYYAGTKIFKVFHGKFKSTKNDKAEIKPVLPRYLKYALLLFC